VWLCVPFILVKRQRYRFTCKSQPWRDDYSFTITHSPIILVNFSSINLVSIFSRSLSYRFIIKNLNIDGDPMVSRSHTHIVITVEKVLSKDILNNRIFPPRSLPNLSYETTTRLTSLHTVIHTLDGPVVFVSIGWCVKHTDLGMSVWRGGYCC
jgi:hypothetical protein